MRLAAVKAKTPCNCSSRVVFLTGRVARFRAGYSEIESAAEEMLDFLVTKLAERSGVTERLRAENQMDWVMQMNLCRIQAEEVVLSDLIYS